LKQICDYLPYLCLYLIPFELSDLEILLFLYLLCSHNKINILLRFYMIKINNKDMKIEKKN